MLKTLPVRRWQSRQWHIEIFDGSPSHLKAMEPQWHCVVRDVISFYSEEACIHGTTGARDEFHLAAIVQNLKTLALRLIRPPPQHACA
jgi:hypothetical protein